MSVPASTALELLLHGHRPGAHVREVASIDIVGPDAVSFADGQLTQELVTLPNGEAAWSFLLTPQGKTVGIVRVWRRSDEYVTLIVEPQWQEVIEERLRSFLFRTNAEISSKTFLVTSVRSRHGLGMVDGAFSAGWEPLSGYDTQSTEPIAGAETLNSDEYETLRIAAGIASNLRELTEERIPNELGIIDSAVSFTKGCYVGQELVARIDSRGRTLHRLTNFVLDADWSVNPGTDLLREHEVVGIVTSVAPLLIDGRRWLLGYIHHSVADYEHVFLPGGTVVTPLPREALLSSIG